MRISLKRFCSDNHILFSSLFALSAGQVTIAIDYRYENRQQTKQFEELFKAAKAATNENPPVINHSHDYVSRDYWRFYTVSEDMFKAELDVNYAISVYVNGSGTYFTLVVAENEQNQFRDLMQEIPFFSPLMSLNKAEEILTEYFDENNYSAVYTARPCGFYLGSM